MFRFLKKKTQLVQKDNVKELLDIFVNQYEKEITPVSNDINKLDVLKNLPKEYIEFMNLTDGLDLGVGNIMSIKDFIEDNEKWKPKFFSGFEGSFVGKNYKAENFMLFASDGMGGYYAFSTKQGDEKIYYFDHENVREVETFKDFVSFLKYRIDLE